MLTSFLIVFLLFVACMFRVVICTLVVEGFKPHPIHNTPLSAESTGKIRINDSLLSINDHKLFGLDTWEIVVATVRSVIANEGSNGKPVTLKFRRAAKDDIPPISVPEKRPPSVKEPVASVPASAGETSPPTGPASMARPASMAPPLPSEPPPPMSGPSSHFVTPSLRPPSMGVAVVQEPVTNTRGIPPVPHSTPSYYSSNNNDVQAISASSNPQLKMSATPYGGAAATVASSVFVGQVQAQEVTGYNVEAERTECEQCEDRCEEKCGIASVEEDKEECSPQCSEFLNQVLLLQVLTDTPYHTRHCTVLVSWVVLI